MEIKADILDYTSLNKALRSAEGDCIVTGCQGQRFIGAGMDGKRITVEGIPGNALGAYLNGASITVKGNAQDAVGDTMNAGEILVHGSVGDAAGYAMRGGRIFVRGSAGYRAGIHMKAYKDKVPVMVIGGRAGSFLGEYQAGGLILVLGLDIGEAPIVGNFPCTGMHGGRLFLRGDCRSLAFPGQAAVRLAGEEDLKEIAGHLRDFCQVFGLDASRILASPFTVAEPDSKNPYKQMYVQN